jgi:hypothetical protein
MNQLADKTKPTVDESTLPVIDEPKTTPQPFLVDGRICGHTVHGIVLLPMEREDKFEIGLQGLIGQLVARHQVDPEAAQRDHEVRWFLMAHTQKQEPAVKIADRKLIIPGR